MLIILPRSRRLAAYVRASLVAVLLITGSIGTWAAIELDRGVLDAFATLQTSLAGLSKDEGPAATADLVATIDAARVDYTRGNACSAVTRLDAFWPRSPPRRPSIVGETLYVRGTTFAGRSVDDAGRSAESVAIRGSGCCRRQIGESPTAVEPAGNSGAAAAADHRRRRDLHAGHGPRARGGIGGHRGAGPAGWRQLIAAPRGARARIASARPLVSDRLPATLSISRWPANRRSTWTVRGPAAAARGLAGPPFAFDPRAYRPGRRCRPIRVN